MVVINPRLAQWSIQRLGRILGSFFVPLTRSHVKRLVAGHEIRR
jgi:hypothetical protein